VHWFYQRIAVYLGLVAYGVIPTSHWFYLNGGWQSEVVRVSNQCLKIITISVKDAFIVRRAMTT